jgi:hypothetical protein
MRRVLRRTLDLAVCIPCEQIFRSRRLAFASSTRSPHRPRLSHLKGSELFEILPYESGASISALQLDRIEFLRYVWIQRLARKICWISALAIPALSRHASKGAPPPREGRGSCVRPEARVFASSRRRHPHAQTPPRKGRGAGRSAQVRKGAASQVHAAACHAAAARRPSFGIPIAVRSISLRPTRQTPLRKGEGEARPPVTQRLQCNCCRSQDRRSLSAPQPAAMTCGCSARRASTGAAARLK